ncbi:site-specific integrase [Arthrobacter sp. IA7]|uniref:tyrosine-type recombinase/integrase n=1 Tax=Arthrobacter ipis TaxID=2716202 RepID=UPI0016867658|nr:site-specific integrase [Arthrobacter ipis]MBD1541045.1 site-specific integrase [Arthrobacter ipis]
MPRPPLQIGTWGKISRDEVSPGVWRAMARFRDFDGVTRKVEARAIAKSKNDRGSKAEQTLISALKERGMPAGEDITADTRLNRLAEVWWVEFMDQDRAINTQRRYREVLDSYVSPGVGGLAIREATVSRLDRFLKATRTKHGNGSAKLAKTVLSAMLGLAARHGAIASNPLRDVAKVPVNRKEVRALTVEEAAALRAGLGQWQLDSSPRGRKRPNDLLDVVDIMLATGARIGEALALRWKDIDLKAERPTLTVTGTVIYVPGEGMTIQEHPKSTNSRQRYYLPAFAVEMLLRRQVQQVMANPWDVVFPSATGTLRDPGNFRKQWRSARDDIGFQWVTPHTFRKSVGTLLAKSEGMASASAQLGHSSEQITSRHYVQKTHEAPDMTALLQAFGRP